MPENPYKTDDREMLSEVMREAESYLSAQLQSGISADARAMTFVSILAAAAAVIATAGFAALLSNDYTSLGPPALAAAGALMVAMALASFSARSVGFSYCGNTPSAWAEDMATRLPLSDALAEQLVHYDEQIKSNNRVLKWNGRLVNLAILVTWLALFGCGVWAAAAILESDRGSSKCQKLISRPAPPMMTLPG